MSYPHFLVGGRAVTHGEALRCIHGYGMDVRCYTCMWMKCENQADALPNTRAFDATAGDAIRAFTDDQLRTECERRFQSGFGVVHEATLRYRDEWRRVAEAAEKSLADALDDRAELTTDRDQWKQKCELAERALWKQKCELAERALKQMDPARDHTPSRSSRLDMELGPGIATKRADNGVPFLDEDLLCEDA